MKERAKMSRWHSATVLNVAPDSRQIWQFAANNGDFALSREQKTAITDPLPAKLVRKDWRNLWQRKLNIAWLPADKIYLRVIQVPAADFNELLSMVELQLEKVSPLPVTQIVWSVETLPRGTDNLQTVIVVIVPRQLVEEFLGQLEGQGYLADRLELPILDQLLATEISEDGVWIYPAEGGGNPCLVAWWYGGALRQLTLLTLPEGPERPTRLKEQLAQIAWAGELEGWLTAPPIPHLVANESTAAAWEPILNEGAEQPVKVIAPVAPVALAAMSARRSAKSEPRANLLPPEYSTRYQQQFVDRLWMGSVGVLLAVYTLGILIYLGAVQVLKFQQGKLQTQVNSLSQQYTNALRLKEQVRILEDQSNLKYAALDCWKATADNLPPELTLTSLTFQRGKTLLLNGSAPADQTEKITDFNEALSKKALVNNLPLDVSPPRFGVARPGPGGEMTVSWDFKCALRTKELE